MELNISDLAIENFGCDAAEHVHSDVSETYAESGFTVTRSSLGGKEYHTVTCGRIWLEPIEKKRALYTLVARLISEHISAYGVRGDVPILAVGLGNPSVTPDSLGPMAADKLIVNGEGGIDSYPRICAVKPGVPARTGIDTSRMIKNIAEMLNAGLIIAVDSQTAKSPERLLGVIQISRGGISPGSALRHTTGEISERTMPCGVISIGVPCVIRSDVFSGGGGEPMFVTRYDSDTALACYSSVIGTGINSAICKLIAST